MNSNRLRRCARFSLAALVLLLCLGSLSWAGQMRLGRFSDEPVLADEKVGDIYAGTVYADTPKPRPRETLTRPIPPEPLPPVAPSPGPVAFADGGQGVASGVSRNWSAPETGGMRTALPDRHSRTSGAGAYPMAYLNGPAPGRAATAVPPGPSPMDHLYAAPTPPASSLSAPHLPELEPPTPEAVEAYRLKLETRLLERYNNLPDYAGRVAKVTAVLSKPLDHSLDGRFIRAEFDQLVYDNWGKRLTPLEKEYFVVTFGSGGAEQVRTDPTIRVGLDMEKTYSERAPLAADPFKKVEPMETFRDTPTIAMPKWWRPEFPELE